MRSALVSHGPRITDARHGVSVRRLDVHDAVIALAGGPTQDVTAPTPAPTPTPSPGPAPSPAPGDHPFTDIDDSIFEHDIIWIYHEKITAGCDDHRYCPTDPVRRDQMASFLARAFHLPATPVDFFSDDEGNIHEDAINRVAAAGITFGCAVNRYCPSGAVTREQMASFLTRASN
ncbi:MAG: S-layer homology domain-containing protein [Candidatus Limnocylindria bacterium]